MLKGFLGFFKKPNILLFPILVFALILRTLSLGVFPYNFDESCQAYVASKYAIFFPSSAQHAIEGGIAELPLFSLFLSWSFRLFGENEISGRLVSVLSSVLTILTIFIIVMKEYSVEEALLSSFLIASDPLTISFSRVAQPYAIMLLFITLGYATIFLGGRLGNKRYLLCGFFFAFAVCIKVIALFHVIIASVFILLTSDMGNMAVQLRVRIIKMALNSLLFISAVSLSIFALSLLISSEPLFFFKQKDIMLGLTKLQAPNIIANLPYHLLSKLLDLMKILFFQQGHGFLVLTGVIAIFYYLVNRKGLGRSKLDILLILWIVGNVLYYFLTGAERYWAPTLIPPLLILASKFIISSLKKVSYYLDQKSRTGTIRFLTCMLLVSFLSIGVVEAFLSVSQMYENPEYLSGYWQVPTYREVGEYIRQNSLKDDYVVTDTHAPVLKYYSQRETFFYMGFDDSSQTVVLLLMYSYKIINPKYHVDTQSFLQMVKFVVMNDPPNRADLSFTYSPFSEDFRAFLDRFYNLDKIFSHNGQPTTWLYKRKETISNNLTYSSYTDWAGSKNLRINWFHRNGGQVVTIGVIYSPSIPWRLESKYGLSEVSYDQSMKSLVVTSKAMADNVTICTGLSLMSLNIPLNENFTISWTWRVSESASLADFGLLIGGIWRPLAYPKYGDLEHVTLGYSDIVQTFGYAPDFLQGIEFSVYVAEENAKLELYDLEINGTPLVLASQIKEEKWMMFPNDTSHSFSILYPDQSAKTTLNLQSYFERNSSTLWLRTWHESSEKILFLAFKRLNFYVEKEYDDSISIYTSGLYTLMWSVTGAISENPIYVLHVPQNFETMPTYLLIEFEIFFTNGTRIINVCRFPLLMEEMRNGV